MAGESPAEAIQRQEAELCVLDEDAFLAALDRLSALADSDATVWEHQASSHDAYRLIAAADVIGERGWVGASRLIGPAPLSTPMTRLLVD